MRTLFWILALVTIVCIVGQLVTARIISIPLAVPQAFHVGVIISVILFSVVAVVMFVTRALERRSPTI